MYKNTLTKFFDEVVQKYPNRNAVIEISKTISFQDLHISCLKLSQIICGLLSKENRKIQIGQGVVAVYLPKGIDSITADIAAMYSGCAYMNLDTKHPKKRLSDTLENIKPLAIVTHKSLMNNLSDFVSSYPIVYIENIGNTEFDEISSTKPRDKVLDIDIACVINTSGSTGVPKGVALSHRGLIDRIKSEEDVGILSDKLEVVASLAPPVFDHHSFEICLLMMKAATLLIIPETFAAFPIRMLELMAQHRASFLLWVPTIMVNIANMDLLTKISLPDLKKIWFAGEVFPTAKFNYWKRNLPEATFVNLYGPTEISVDCTYFVVDRDFKDDEPIPIGRPFTNTEVHLLDPQGNEARDGEEGEICVRGSCLALGYFNNREKTKASFVQSPFTNSYPETLYKTGDLGVRDPQGLIIFKGRKDNLIKHLGYRIELGEIESVVSSLPLIKNCCVQYLANEKKIVLFYEADLPIDEKEFRIVLTGVLPKYMVPTRYIFLKQIPMNNNGKIDRLKLRNLSGVVKRNC